MLLRIFEGHVVLGQTRLPLPVLQQNESDLLPSDRLDAIRTRSKKNDGRKKSFTISSSVAGDVQARCLRCDRCVFLLLHPLPRWTRDGNLVPGQIFKFQISKVKERRHAHASPNPNTFNQIYIKLLFFSVCCISPIIMNNPRPIYSKCPVFILTIIIL